MADVALERWWFYFSRRIEVGVCRSVVRLSQVGPSVFVVYKVKAVITFYNLLGVRGLNFAVAIAVGYFDDHGKSLLVF